jgi:formiminoglutamase
MDKLILFSETQLDLLLIKRPGESKFGEHIKLLSNVTDIYEQLKNLDVDYVIFGVSEDIGAFANSGNTGTSQVWNAVIKNLLNIQSNSFTHAKRVLILGYLNFDSFNEKLKNLKHHNTKDITKARKLVSKIDKHVTELVFKIVEAGKIPIVVGGGHNNAYGNIKGTSLALKKPINVINFDSQSNFCTEDGRHSGNGFTYAKSEGFLNNYFIFGLHEDNISDDVLKIIRANETIDYSSFESIVVRKSLKFRTALKKASEHVNTKPYGIEIDCSAIQNIPSIDQSPSGFGVNKTRTFVDHFGKHENVTYLHISEAAPHNLETETTVGKLITYLITDFIRAHES